MIKLKISFNVSWHTRVISFVNVVAHNGWTSKKTFHFGGKSRLNLFFLKSEIRYRRFEKNPKVNKHGVAFREKIIIWDQMERDEAKIDTKDENLKI